MKSLAQIKEEVLNESSQPQNLFIEVKHKNHKTYTVKLLCGLGVDYERFVNLMRIEGYTVFG